MNMQDNFVDNDIALAMKELGFDEEVCAIFRKDRFYPILGFERINSVKKSVIAAPLYQQCIDWFRENYQLLIDSPKPDEWNSGKWSVKITSLDNSIILEEHVGQPYWRIYRCFKTYQEAHRESILKAIQLIKERKQ